IANVTPFAGGSEKPLWRISMTPSQAPAFVMALRMKFAADAYYDWQGGLVWLCLEKDVHHTEIREELALRGGGNAMLLRASRQSRLDVQVFQPLPAPVQLLSERVRTALDSKGTFNPGRMTGD